MKNNCNHNFKMTNQVKANRFYPVLMCDKCGTIQAHFINGRLSTPIVSSENETTVY